MELCALSSGSRGNATLIRDGNNALLVDNGLSLSALIGRMESRDIDPRDVKGILVTHEHIDHIKGIFSFAKKFDTPIFLSEYIADGIIERAESGGLDIREIDETGFSFAGFDIEPFRVPHDALYTVGYRVSKGKESVGVATDIGVMTDNILKSLSPCNLVMLESNHDTDMLMNGRYPYKLKIRIRSDKGHLSNNECADTLLKLRERGVKKFILAHLSEDNNSPEIAFDAVKSVFDSERLVEGKDYITHVASQHTASKIVSCKEQ